jgi:hypothetical protein
MAVQNIIFTKLGVEFILALNHLDLTEGDYAKMDLTPSYCKITYFFWDFISCFCHVVSLQQSKIRVYGRVLIENPLNIFLFAGFISAIITPLQKSRK